MKMVITIIQAACVLAAAAILGNWFLAELRKSRNSGRPWYAVYLTAPGIIILCIIFLLPLFVHFRLM